MRPIGFRLHPAQRTLLALSAVVTLGFALLCALLLLDDRQTAARNADHTADTLAAAVAQDISRTIGLYDLSLQAVAHGLQFPGLWDLPADLRQMVLFDRTAGSQQFGFLNVLNAAGDVVADMQAKTPRAANFALRDYFQAHKRNPQDQLYIGRPVLTAPGQPATLPLSRRLSHPDGSFAGVVVGSMRLATVQDLFARLDLGPQGSIALLRNDGVVLMRLPFNQDDIGRTLPASAAFFRGQSHTDAVDPDRIARRTTFHLVAELPLTVAIGFAEADVDRPWQARAGWLVAIFGLLCLCNLGLIALTRRAADRQARAEAAARRADAEKSRFLATMSHELRTPLTSILGYAELLTTDTALRPEQAGPLAALTAAGAHMRDVIDRVLDFTREEALASAPRPEPTDLDALVAQCRFLIEPDARARGLTLSCRIAPDLPRRLLLDGSHLRQALVNLLSNAVKYTDRGDIELRLAGSATRLHCAVADTGPGVPPGKRGRLFREYDRLDAGEVAGGGFGLGLSIAARLVRGMDGRIGYQDNPGGGSIFWLEVPAAAAPPAARSAAPPPQPNGTALRVLLIDDNATNRDIAASFLTAAGHEVVQASDGAQGVQHATTERFDLIITDMRMPRMNGLETARHIRALPGLSGRIPIMLLTADMLVARQDGYREAEISLLLPKPYSAAGLLDAVRMATGARRAHPPEPVAPPILDRSMLDELGETMSADNVEAHLRTLSGRISDLLARLRHPQDADPDTLDDLVHDTAGAAGLLGFLALSAALRCYQHLDRADAATHEEATAGVIDLAEASLGALRDLLPAAQENQIRA